MEENNNFDVIKSKQMQSLISYAKEKGFLCEDDCLRFYSSKYRIDEILKYLMYNNILKRVSIDRYEYIRESDKSDEKVEEVNPINENEEQNNE